MIGWFGGDAVEWVGDRAGDVADVVSSVWEGIPGSEWIDDFTGALTGPMQTWAQSDSGMAIFRAIGTAAAAALAPYVGPTAAAVAFAIPGIARGEKFEQAWIKEFVWRLQKTAEILVGDLGEAAMKEVSDKLGAQATAAAAKLAERARLEWPGLPVDVALRQAEIEIDKLARDLGIRPDMVALALTALLKDLDLAERIDALYNPQTGQSYERESLEAALRPAFVPGGVRTSVAGKAATAAALTGARVGVQDAPMYAMVRALGYQTTQPRAPAVAARAPERDAPTASTSARDIGLTAAILAAGGGFAFWWLRLR